MNNEVKSRAIIAKAFEDSPLFMEFLRPFPNLLGRGRGALESGFKRIAQALSNSKRSASIQFTIHSGKRTRQWSVFMSPSGAQAKEGKNEHPNLEIITDDECWSQVARGDLAPLEAFGRGRMRVRGSIELARLVARGLQRQVKE